MAPAVAVPPVADPDWAQPDEAWVVPEHYNFTPPFTATFVQDVDESMDAWLAELERTNQPDPTAAEMRHRRWYVQQWMLLGYFDTKRQAYEVGWHGGGGHAVYEGGTWPP